MFLLHFWKVCKILLFSFFELDHYDSHPFIFFSPLLPSPLPVDADCTYQVASLLGQGRRLYVGTVSGLVAVFDSMTYNLLTHFLWHKGKVRSLLLLPEEIKACVCAEVPFKGSESSKPAFSNFERRVSHATLAGSVQDNPLFMPNPGGKLAMIASIGNGRRKYSCAPKPEKNSSLTRSLTGASVRDDVTLLLWNS